MPGAHAEPVGEARSVRTRATVLAAPIAPVDADLREPGGRLGGTARA